MPRRAKWSADLIGVAAAEDALEAFGEDWSVMGEYVVLSRVHYAVYVEFGTKYMPANGALRAAVKKTLANLDAVCAGCESADEVAQAVAENIRDLWKANVWVDTGNLKRSIHVERGAA